MSTEMKSSHSSIYLTRFYGGVNDGWKLQVTAATYPNPYIVVTQAQARTLCVDILLPMLEGMSLSTYEQGMTIKDIVLFGVGLLPTEDEA